MHAALLNFAVPNNFADHLGSWKYSYPQLPLLLEMVYASLFYFILFILFCHALSSCNRNLIVLSSQWNRKVIWI